MQGFANKAIQNFVCDMYGRARWSAITRDADAGVSRFEPFLTYDAEITQNILTAAEDNLGLPRAAILEDLGHYLVAHPHNESLRRLLRFSGASFEDFVLSLDELPDRARLVVDDINLPSITIRQELPETYELILGSELRGFVWVLIGALRAMADDYGALALIDKGDRDGRDAIHLTLANASFASGRQFDLARKEVPLAG